MKTRTVSTIALAAFLLILTLPAPAQEERPSWMTLTFVSVKPDMEAEFLDLLKTHWLPAVKKSDLPFMETWRAARFGDLYEFVFAAPIRSFAEFDGQSPIQKAMKPEEYAVLFSRLSECVNSVRTIAQVSREDLSYDTLEGKPPTLAVVSTVMVKPGKTAEYEKLIQDEMLPNFKKLDFQGVWSNQTVFGGPQHQWTHLTLIENFAHIDKGPPMLRAVGPEEAAKIEARFSALIDEETLRIYARIPDLSHRKE